MGMKDADGGRAKKVEGSNTSPKDETQYGQGIVNAGTKAKAVGTEQKVGGTGLPPVRK